MPISISPASGTARIMVPGYYEAYGTYGTYYAGNTTTVNYNLQAGNWAWPNWQTATVSANTTNQIWWHLGTEDVLWPKANKDAIRLRRLAERKSKALLKEILGDHRYRAYREKGLVWIESRKDPSQAYEIRPSRMIRLHKKVNGVWLRTKGELCIHPQEHLPEGDEVAAIVLLAKYDEADLWKTANLHGDPELIAA